MAGELLFLLVILVAVAIGIAIVRAKKKQRGITRKDWDRFYIDPEQSIADKREQLNTANEPDALTLEEESRLELARLQKLITDRKKIAWETDISCHVWSLYKSHFRSMGPHAINPYSHDGKSYSISSDSPKAFILGDWIKGFINVSLKHQNIRKQEIRAQKHQERLREIEELRDRFGIAG